MSCWTFGSGTSPLKTHFRFLEVFLLINISVVIQYFHLQYYPPPEVLVIKVNPVLRPAQDHF